jgi:hypothetical protein
MKIGFLNNQIDNRGTGNAVFHYAHYNEVILGNKSKIFTLPNANHSEEAVSKFVNRFGEIHAPSLQSLGDIDVLYHIKSGTLENYFTPPNGRYVVHAVFESNFPHGDRFATISEWMGKRDSLPFVPHIVELANTKVDFREQMEIPQDATVFGRHGGWDSFDISWAWEAVTEALGAREDVYFIFLNTEPVIDHPRVLHFPATLNEGAKRAFINTCDAMLHARSRGETFGISVGEFAILGKPVFTYDGSYEKAHIYELRGTARTYTDKADLLGQLLAFQHGETNHPFYDHYTPKNVMAKFKEVFLD